jgi:hypothetical protein
MSMNFSKMDTMSVRSVVSMEEASQADTELSPEPSPVGPPAPQEFPSLPMNTNGSTNRNTMHYNSNNYSKSPMVQNELFGGAGDTHSDDDNDESLPSLPDEAPSPYSPPPSSLFSGNVGDGGGDWFKQSNGKSQTRNGNSQSGRNFHYPPLSEVRLQQSAPPSAYSTRSMGSSVNVNTNGNASAASTRNRSDHATDDDTFYSEQSLGRRMHRTLNQNPTAPARFSLSPSASQEHWSPASQSLHQQQEQQYQQQQQQQQPSIAQAATTPGAAERSMLLPAVQSLKKELHLSHENMYLLQEENKALADECGRYEELSGRWQQQADEQMAVAAEHEMALSQQVQELRQENEQVVAMNESLQERVQEALIGTELLSEQQQQADRTRDEMEAKLREVTREKEAATVAVANARKENERLTVKLSEAGVASRDVQGNADQKLKIAEEKAESLETKNAELVTRMGEVRKETNNKLKMVKTESGAELAGMRKENSSLGFEIDRLKATVKEQSRRSIKETAKVSANSVKLEEEIERLQSLLSESSSKAELGADLASKEKENWSCGLEIDRLRAVVSEQKRRTVKEAAEASASVAKLEKEVDRLQTLSNASNGKAEMEVELVAKKKEIASLGLEIDRLKAMVKDQGRRGAKEIAVASANTAKLEEKIDLLESRLSESNGKNNGLRAEKLALRKELVQRHRSRNDVECQTDIITEVEVPPPTSKPTGVNAGTQTTGSQTLQASTQTSSLQTLQATTQTTDRQTCNGGTQTSTPISGTRSFGVGTDTTATITGSKSFGGTQTLYDDEVIHSIGPALSSSQKVTERLGRIRDAAERAALFKDYSRDLDRIKAQHETEKESLKTSHNEKMKNVVHNAKTELNSRSKEYKRRLQSEYDAKVAALESKHLQELTRVRTVCFSRRLSLMSSGCWCSCSFLLNDNLTLCSFFYLLSYCRTTYVTRITDKG